MIEPGFVLVAAPCIVNSLHGLRECLLKEWNLAQDSVQVAVPPPTKQVMGLIPYDVYRLPQIKRRHVTGFFGGSCRGQHQASDRRTNRDTNPTHAAASHAVG